MIKKIMTLSLGLMTFSALTTNVDASGRERNTYRKHVANKKSVSDDLDEDTLDARPSRRDRASSQRSKSANSSASRSRSRSSDARRMDDEDEPRGRANRFDRGSSQRSKSVGTSPSRSRSRSQDARQHEDDGYDHDRRSSRGSERRNRSNIGSSIAVGATKAIGKAAESFGPIATTFVDHKLSQDRWKQEQEARRQEREWELQLKKEERKQKQKMIEKQEERRRLNEEKKRQEEEEARRKEQEARDPRKLREMKKRQLEEKKSECELDFEDQLTARNLGDADRADRLIENIEKEGCSVILEQVEDTACNLLMRGRMDGIPKSLGGARCAKQWEKENGARMKFDRKEGMYLVPSEDEYEEEVEVVRKSKANEEPKAEPKVETPAPTAAPVQQRMCRGPRGPKPC